MTYRTAPARLLTADREIAPEFSAEILAPGAESSRVYLRRRKAAGLRARDLRGYLTLRATAVRDSCSWNSCCPKGAAWPSQLRAEADRYKPSGITAGPQAPRLMPIGKADASSRAQTRLFEPLQCGIQVSHALHPPSTFVV